jgi:uncharacterized protein YecT (DUF1311 family)
MIRIAVAASALALAALSPLVSAAGRGPADAPVPSATSPAGSPSGADTAALEACLGQKGARQAAKCVGHVADVCIRSSAAGEAECYGREAEGWSALIEDYRSKLEKRLVTDRRKLGELQEGQRAWFAERTARCGSLASSAPCEMKESGRRALQLRLIAEQAGVVL